MLVVVVQRQPDNASGGREDVWWLGQIGRPIKALSPYLNEDADIARTPPFRVPSCLGLDRQSRTTTNVIVATKQRFSSTQDCSRAPLPRRSLYVRFATSNGNANAKMSRKRRRSSRFNEAQTSETLEGVAERLYAGCLLYNCSRAKNYSGHYFNGKFTIGAATS